MRYGTAIVGSSFASVTDGSMLETSENEDIGLLVSQSASSEISGKIVSQNNNNIGMLVGISSGVRMDGVVNILNNMDAGMVINQASSVQTSANNILTVKGTKPGSEGYSIGISITENSTLSSSGTVEVSENIGGTLKAGEFLLGGVRISLSKPMILMESTFLWQKMAVMALKFRKVLLDDFPAV